MDKEQCDPLQLSKALDSLGVSPKMVAFRVSIMKDIQLVNNFLEPLGENSPLCTGSVAEGTVCPAIMSDVDIMMSNDFREVTDLDNLKCWSPKHDLDYVLVMRDYFTHYGYVQLAVFSGGTKLKLKSEHNHPFVKDGNVFLLSSKLYMGYMSYLYPSRQVNGPAIIEVHEKRTSNMCPLPIDNVYCLRCRIWPSQAREWLTRKRRYGWPSQNQLNDAKHGGCFLLPVGYPSGLKEDTE